MINVQSILYHTRSNELNWLNYHRAIWIIWSYGYQSDVPYINNHNIFRTLTNASWKRFNTWILDRFDSSLSEEYTPIVYYSILGFVTGCGFDGDWYDAVVLFDTTAAPAKAWFGCLDSK